MTGLRFGASVRLMAKTDKKHATLYISIPAEIYDVIAQRAKDAHRPISAQVGMVLLAYAKKWLPANGNRA